MTEAQAPQSDGDAVSATQVPREEVVDSSSPKETTLKFNGLTAAEVEANRQKYGDNVLTPPKREPWWKLYLQKFEDPVIRILMIAAGITILVGIVDGQFVEGIGIIIAIMLATTLAFVNEYRANKEFDILNQVNNDIPVQVIRDGAYTTVPRRDLVVGDVALIEVGDEIPADGLVLEAVSLKVNEALLTGESLPVRKVVHRPGDGADSVSPAGSESSFPQDKVFRGTMVVDGRGIVQITEVGDSTRIGRIARQAAEETGEVTPLNAQLERLSKLIGVVGFLVAALTFAALVVRGVSVGELTLASSEWLFSGILLVSALVMLVRVWLPIVYDAFELAGRPKEPPKWLDEGGLRGWLTTFVAGALLFVVATVLGILLGWLPSAPERWLPAHVGQEFLHFFMIAVTIIVVAVPEGLAMSVTLSLAYSMRKMTATNNLVRRMHACETIGAATVICSDKTGTLTLNQMRVHEFVIPALNGAALTKDLASEAEKLIAEAIAVNTTANLSRKPGEPIKPIGDTTEGALLLWLEDRGVDYLTYRANFDVKYQLTFSTERKYMGTQGISAINGQSTFYVKGAPELVLAHSDRILTPEGSAPLNGQRGAIEEELRNYQKRGMRTLGFAYRPAPAGEADLEIEQIAESKFPTDDLIWMGFVAISDPVRPDVTAALQSCRDAGIDVKMVTGDNPETAQEIARQIGLISFDEDGRDHVHMGAKEFESLDDSVAKDSVLKLKVLSRARPEDKMRLVRLLQENRQVVAVTGDGTNDAPALNYANVGLAMGSGTDIAKEASDIVLLDDSFKSIVNAVMWGRSLYDNIQRFILFQLTINVAALGIALLGPFIGVKFPLTVIQMLWVNLIMDTFASLALATEPPHWEVMKRPPRKPSDFIISGRMARGILGVGGTYIVALVLLLFHIQNDGVVSDYELSVFYTAFVLLQFWNLFNARVLGLTQSALKGVLENRSFIAIALAILIGQVIITQFGGAIFRTVPLSLIDWLIILAATSLVLWVGEGWRFLMRRASAGNR